MVIRCCNHCYQLQKFINTCRICTPECFVILKEFTHLMLGFDAQQIKSSSTMKIPYRTYLINKFVQFHYVSLCSYQQLSWFHWITICSSCLIKLIKIDRFICTSLTFLLIFFSQTSVYSVYCVLMSGPNVRKPFWTISRSKMCQVWMSGKSFERSRLKIFGQVLLHPSVRNSSYVSNPFSVRTPISSIHPNIFDNFMTEQLGSTRKAVNEHRRTERHIFIRCQL